jgi:hypothetical protein
MHIRDAMIKVISGKEYAVHNGHGVTLLWDGHLKQYNVIEEEKVDTPFNNVDDAVDYFLKITEDDRLSRTEEERELGFPSPQ